MAGDAQLNLAQVFQAVSKTLNQNQDSLNEADTYNHDHGSNMVEVFNLATKLLQKKKSNNPEEQLTYVGEQLQSKLGSGSAKAYADGFLRAAQQFKGQQNIRPEDAMTLVQALMGSQSASQPEQPAQPAGGDMLSSLLGAFSPGLEEKKIVGDIDAGDVLKAGMAFFQSQQRGESTMESLIGAVMAGSQMGSTPARSQSGKLVASTILQMLSR
jgi:hypothetical protein